MVGADLHTAVSRVTSIDGGRTETRNCDVSIFVISELNVKSIRFRRQRADGSNICGERESFEIVGEMQTLSSAVKSRINAVAVEDC